MSFSNRSHFLDSSRGFAVAGILLVNAADLMCLRHDVPVRPFQAAPLTGNVLSSLVVTRFVLIFSFMLRMNMGLIIDPTIRRGASAWKILLHRLAAFLVIRLLRSIFYPGEILCDYVVAGAVLLLFALEVSHSVCLVSGLLTTVGAYAFTGGGALSLPGLFLLGSVARVYDLPIRLGHVDRRIGAVTFTLAVTSAATIPWQAAGGGNPRLFTTGGVVKGLIACLYVCLLMLLWRTSVR